MFKRKPKQPQIPFSVVAAIVIATVSLAVSAGVARWSWLILDEQVQLRKDFVELQEKYDQIGVQYEYWLNELIDERKAVEEEAAE